MRNIYIYLPFFISCLFLSINDINAKTDFTQPSLSPSLIPHITEEDFKSIEINLLKSAEAGLGSENISIRGRAEVLTVLLDIYNRKKNKSGLSKTLNRISMFSYDALKFDGSEEGLHAGLGLARMYISSYRIKKDRVFKGHATNILSRIEDVYFDKNLNSFVIKAGGRPKVFATANALGALVFLEAMDVFDERYFADIVKGSIEYIINNMIKNGGVFHVFYPDTSMSYMDGQLVDNATTGVALLEGYKILKDNKYLDISRKTAEFLRERLYDEKLGGFIMRNSNSEKNYPEGEDLYINDKPFEENGIAAYLYQSVYETTGDKRYKDIADGTLGYLISLYKDTPPQAQVYFISAVYNSMKPDGIKKGKQGEKLNWGAKLPETGILPLAILSFLAGMLSFLSPCTLPILPAYFAFTFQGDKSRIMAMTFFFFLGLAMVFSVMGATAGFIGSFLRVHISAITTIGGTLIIIFGFMSFIGKGFSGANLFHRSPSATLGGAFIFGVFMAFGWTACVGPILAGILILAATEEGLIKGAGLLFIYALGLGLPLMVISLMFKNMDRDGMFWRFLKGKGWEVNILGHTLLLHSTSMISGIIFISLGVLMVSGYLAYINLLLPLETQVWFADIEDKLMEMFK